MTVFHGPWGPWVISPDVRFGPKADIEAPPDHVRFPPESGHSLKRLDLAEVLLFDHLAGGRKDRERQG